MVIKGFSKVENLVDEDDEAEETLAKAQVAYERAHAAYCENRKSKAEILKQFQDVEVLMEPFLRNGLTGLPITCLEWVLKGRLHQAVLIAQTPQASGKWERVRDLTEQVLQYDVSNCHAHYLRGMALWQGFKLRREAADALRKAISHAKQQGKMFELEQWKAGVEGMLNQEPDSAEDEELKALLASSTEPVQPEPQIERPSKDVEPEAPPAAAPAAPSLKKGFLNASRRKASGKTEASASTATAPADQASAPRPAAARASAEAAAAPVEEQERLVRSREGEVLEQKRLLEEKCRQLEARERELAELRGQLRGAEEKDRQLQEVREQLRKAEDSQQRQLEAHSLQLEEWQHELCEQLGTLSSELEQTISDVASQGSGVGLVGEVEAAREAAAKTQEDLEASRKWAEGEQQRLTDLATEVATVREMASKELREREEASRQQISEVRELVGRVGQLKSSAKALREQAKQKATVEEQHAELEKDVGQLADQIALFRALPARAKAAAMLGDGAMQLLVVFAFLLGLLLMLGIIGEWFRPKCCGMSSAR